MRWRRQLEAEPGALFGEKCVRRLDKNTRAVTCVFFATTSTAMLEILKNAQGLCNDGMRLTALHMHDKTDATGVVFVRRIVQTTPALLFLVQVRSPIIIYLVVPGRRIQTNFRLGKPVLEEIAIAAAKGRKIIQVRGCGFNSIRGRQAA